MDSMMGIVEEKAGATTILGLRGSLDITTSSQVEETLHGLIDGGEKQVVLDFSQLDYISSSGLRVLHTAAIRAKNAKAQIILCCMNNRVKQVFDISGFSHIFSFYESRDEAVNHFGEAE